MYRLNRLFSVGFDVDYLTDFWNGALIQDDWEFYSDNGFESNAANGLWIGPELDYGFWPARRLNMHFDLALGVFSLTGTTNEFQGTPAFFDRQVETNGSGYGGKFKVILDYYFTRHLSLGVGMVYALVYQFSWITQDSFEPAGAQEVGVIDSQSYVNVSANLGLTYWWAPVPAGGPLLWNVLPPAERQVRALKRAAKLAEKKKVFQGLAALHPSGWGLRLQGGWGSYAMADTYLSSAIAPSGWEGGLTALYRLNPRLELGFDADYLTAGETYPYWASPYYGTSVLNFPVLWLGPEMRVTYWPASAVDVHWGVGIDYMQTVGADYTFTPPLPANVPSGQLSTMILEAKGVGGQLLVGSDYHFSRHLALGLDLGFRDAYLIGPANNPETPQPRYYTGSYFEAYWDLGLTYWF